MFETTAYESLYCDTCHRDGLWPSLLCTRLGSYFADNGPDPVEGLASRYEGTCLRCCGHNHG